MTIQHIRSDLATLKDKGDVSGPLALFLGNVLDRIEALERPASAIRSDFFPVYEHAAISNCAVCHGFINTKECPACSKRKTNEGAKA